MHTSRVALMIISVLGMISTLFDWRTYDQRTEQINESGLAGMANKANISNDLVTHTGLETQLGFVSIALFAFVLILSLMGKRSEPIKTGTIKFTLLLVNAGALVFHIVVISLFMIGKYYAPAFGIYVAFGLSFVALIIPYLFKPSGDFGAMSPKEIMDDIEDSADEFEDKVEDIGDKIEDDMEDVFKKKSKEKEEAKEEDEKPEEENKDKPADSK